MSDNSGISRRTIVRGAAWTAPVITLAATAPAVAASVTCRATRTGTAAVELLGVDRIVTISRIGLPPCGGAPATPLRVTVSVGRGAARLEPASTSLWGPSGVAGNPITFTTLGSYAAGTNGLDLGMIVSGYPAGTTLSWTVSADGYVDSRGSVFIN